MEINLNLANAEGAAAAVRKWWSIVGWRKYPKAKKMLITADSGGSNGYRVHLWKAQLQILADELGIEITVLHFPPGTNNMEQS